MSYMTTGYFVLCLHLIRPGIRPLVTKVVSLVIADGHLIFYIDLFGYALVNTLVSPPTSSPPNTYM